MISSFVPALISCDPQKKIGQKQRTIAGLKTSNLNRPGFSGDWMCPEVRGKKNGALHSVIRVSDQVAISACFENLAQTLVAVDAS